MKSAVATVPAPAGRRASRSAVAAGSASRRKPAVRRKKLPPEESLAHIPKLLRAIWHPDFMRFGRPDDYGERRENQE